MYGEPDLVVKSHLLGDSACRDVHNSWVRFIGSVLRQIPAEFAVLNSLSTKMAGFFLSAGKHKKMFSFTVSTSSICCVAIDGNLAGYLALADSPRPEAAAAVQQLLSCGIVVAMLTGDNPGAAAAVAATVGLEGEHVHASLLPQDKFDAVSLPCNRHLITLESAPLPVSTVKAGPEYHLSLFYVKGCEIVTSMYPDTTGT